VAWRLRVSTGFSIVLLAGWGSLPTAMTIRAFDWLPALFLIALYAAGAVAAYRGVRDTPRNIASTRRPPASELGRALLVQVALLPLYGFYGWYYAADSPSSPAWWFYALMGSMWVLVTALFVVWWREGRHRLVRGAVIWGLLAWATLLLPLLLPWERSRRLLVPAPPACVSSGNDSPG
jgi:hypothetical protein